MLSLLLSGPASAGGPWGEQGSAVRLVVGYQTYYTASWSGMVLRAKRFYERYLPAGSTVQWEIGLHGPVILAALRERREDIGYLGDLPALAAVARPDLADLRLVAVTGLSSSLCNSLLVRTDAPGFADSAAAIAWLAGKRVAAAFGGCSDRFARQLFDRGHISPADYANLTPTVLPSAFSAGLLDAAVVQEPVAAQLIAAGLARRVLTGADLGEKDAAFLVVSDDLMRARPDIVTAWLEAELDAELFMAAPEHAAEIAEIAASQTLGFEQPVLRTALYGDQPGEIRLGFPFILTDPVRTLIARATLFMADAGQLPSDGLRPAAIDDGAAREVLRRRHLTAPIGEVRGTGNPAPAKP